MTRIFKGAFRTIRQNTSKPLAVRRPHLCRTKSRTTEMHRNNNVEKKPNKITTAVRLRIAFHVHGTRQRYPLQGEQRTCRIRRCTVCAGPYCFVTEIRRKNAPMEINYVSEANNDLCLFAENNTVFYGPNILLPVASGRRTPGVRAMRRVFQS